MAKANARVSDTANREIVITRLISAPRALVFQAFTQPEHLIQWWGPNGFTNTFEEIDVRPGGVWRFIMHGPDGTDYPNHIVFKEIVPNERISHLHGSKADDPDAFEATITFEEENGKTKVTLRTVLPTAEACEAAKRFGAVEGGQQTLARLENNVLANASGKAFVLTRTLKAPRELVWKMFTQPEHLMHWWGPKGFTMHHAKMELRTGGVFHFGLKAPDGYEMWARFLFREIKAPERLAFLNSFSDPQGKVARAPMSDTWPLLMLNVITFDEQGEQTIVTLRGCAVNATEEEMKTFESGTSSMHQGFGASFDVLETYMSSLKK